MSGERQGEQKRRGVRAMQCMGLVGTQARVLNSRVDEGTLPVVTMTSDVEIGVQGRLPRMVYGPLLARAALCVPSDPPEFPLTDAKNPVDKTSALPV